MGEGTAVNGAGGLGASAGATLPSVPFHNAVSPAELAEAGGDIDYRLARQSVLRAFREGRVGTDEICDAHPELMRVARSSGEPTQRRCEVCDDVDLVQVRYVFGPRLSKGGRCVTTAAELERIAARKGTFTCYTVEVCPGCGWNHLARSHVLEPRA